MNRQWSNTRELLWRAGLVKAPHNYAIHKDICKKRPEHSRHQHWHVGSCSLWTIILEAFVAEWRLKFEVTFAQWSEVKKKTEKRNPKSDRQTSIKLCLCKMWRRLSFWNMPVKRRRPLYLNQHSEHSFILSHDWRMSNEYSSVRFTIHDW